MECVEIGTPMETGRGMREVQKTDWTTLLRRYARLFASSPDLFTTVEDEMLSGDVYTATWTMVGQFR